MFPVSPHGFTHPLSHELSHGSNEGTPARDSPPGEGGGDVVPAPASVTSLPSDTLAFRPHQLSATSSERLSGSHTQNAYRTTPPGNGAKRYDTDGASAGSSTSDANADATEPSSSNTSLGAQGGSGAHASASAFDEMDEGKVWDDLSDFHLLYHELRQPGDAPPISLEAAMTMQNPAFKSHQKIDLKKMTPALELHGAVLPVEPHAKQRKGASKKFDNRQYVVAMVANLLEGNGYHIDYLGKQGNLQSPTLYVSDLASGKQYRLFFGMSTMKQIVSLKDDFVQGSDLLAHVAIDPDDLRTLKSLYLIPLEP